MDANIISNFSIDSILGAEVGLGSSFPVGAESLHNVESLPTIYLHGVTHGFNGSWNYERPRPLTTFNMVPIVALPYHLDSSGRYLGYGSTGYYHHHLNTNTAVGQSMAFTEDRDSQVLHYRGHKLRCRMRTVFTDSQTKCLEELFEITDYPGVDTRAELARNSGLTEETVRVWFKNRRARRKRQKSGNKVKNSPTNARREVRDGTPHNQSRVLQDKAFSAIL